MSLLWETEAGDLSGTMVSVIGVAGRLTTTLRFCFALGSLRGAWAWAR